MHYRSISFVAAIALLCGAWNGPVANAQQTYTLPTPVAQLQNVPTLPWSSFHYSGRFDEDGLYYLWDGTNVWRQDGVNVDAFTSIGQVANVPNDSGGTSANMSDAGPINFSRDGQHILLGNGLGGWAPYQNPPEEYHVGRIFSMPIAGTTVSDPIGDIDYHYDLIPLPTQSTIAGADHKYFVDYGCEDFMTTPLSWVSVFDETTGSHQIVVDSMPGASACITTDKKGNLFACIGYGNTRGLIKRFDREAVDLAYQTATPLAWADGVAINPSNYNNQSGAGLFFDARGYLFAGGNEGLTVFRPNGSSGTFDVGGGVYSSMHYNPENDQILVMTSNDTTFEVYQAGDFLPLIPGDANWDDVVDEEDASIVSDNWYEQNVYGVEGDFNGDNVVDAIDAAIMAAHWGDHHESSDSPTTGVPEPGTTMLLLTMLMGLLLRRHCRN